MAVFLIAGLAAFFYTPSRWGSAQFFFDGQASDAILDLAGSAKKQILIQMYSFTHEGVIKNLEVLHRRGVDVRVIADNRDENAPLAKANFPVRWEQTERMFHRKLAIVDEQWIWIGSTNWTYSGMTKNAEVDLLLSSPDHAARLIQDFEADWAKSKRSFK